MFKMLRRERAPENISKQTKEKQRIKRAAAHYKRARKGVKASVSKAPRIAWLPLRLSAKKKKSKKR